MNLLNLLLGSMTSEDTVNTLSQKTGASSKQVSMLITLALPLLIKYLTKNASSQSGAQSLLGALMQHTNKNSMADQVAQADEEDGKKILQHILGDRSTDVMNDLAGKTGLSGDQVSQLLGSLAPSMMSGLSAAANKGSNQQSEDDGFDLSDLAGIFGVSKENQGGGFSALSILKSLFGKDEKTEDTEKDDNLNGTSLLKMLMSMK